MHYYGFFLTKTISPQERESFVYLLHIFVTFLKTVCYDKRTGELESERPVTQHQRSGGGNYE